MNRKSSNKKAEQSKINISTSHLPTLQYQSKIGNEKGMTLTIMDITCFSSLYKHETHRRVESDNKNDSPRAEKKAEDLAEREQGERKKSASWPWNDVTPMILSSKPSIIYVAFIDFVTHIYIYRYTHKCLTKYRDDVNNNFIYRAFGILTRLLFMIAMKFEKYY